MNSLGRIGNRSASLPLSADDVLEFHAARLLLLFSLCGVSGRIDGLTKLAKLDFFARYPEFFDVAARKLDATDTQISPQESEPVEAAMVRHHYGPWDKRYYHVLAHLESRGLITVSKHGRTYRLILTDLGKQRAKTLTKAKSFAPLVDRMRQIKKVFGAKSGTFLKNHIYAVFEDEVGKQKLGRMIE